MRNSLTTAQSVLLLILGALVLGAPATFGDDRDLLRTGSSKPYLMIVLDTSSSMALSPTNEWVEGNADDPGSRFYQAKEVLYEVFKDVNDVHLGFATFNQDTTGVRAKHWRYDLSIAADLGSLPIDFPLADDTWVFGGHLGDGSNGTAGSCAAPLDLRDDFEATQAARFPKLDTNGEGPTRLYLRQTNNKVYRVTLTTLFNSLGNPTMSVDVLYEQVDNSNCNKPPVSSYSTTLEFLKPPSSEAFEFLMVEAAVGDSVAAGNGGGNAAESLAGYWDWLDVETSAICPGSNVTKRGEGLEDNYDGTFSSPPSFAPNPLVDPYGHCANRNDPASCENLKFPTTESAFGRPLDTGDLLPLHWQIDNKDEFLSRLAPNHFDGGTPDFGIASYFKDDPDGGYFPLASTGQRPVMAAGDTPLGRAVGEFRCWYLGNGANKCNSALYGDGWESVAQQQDSEWGCRKPYLIVISDGEDTCGGPNPCSDTANLFSKAGIQTWVVAYGDYGANCSQAKNPLKCMATNGKGELVCPTDPTSLEDELRAILGEIREEARSFASAAVPSVQANVDDKIVLANFTPLAGSSAWDGHLLSFTKPLPLVNGLPDVSSSRLNWDAGEELLSQAPTAAQADSASGGDLSGLKLGNTSDARRVFYTREIDSNGDVNEPGEWPGQRRQLVKTDDITDAELRYDLWNGFAIPYDADNLLQIPPVDQIAQDRANQVIAETLAIKTETVDLVDPDTGVTSSTDISFVLGDIFHSNPIVVGAPPNVNYFAKDLGGDNNPSTTCNDPSETGYRCFFEKHQHRRKMVVVGANDGMFHAFDGGLPSADADGEVTFDNGSGRELFSYIPRQVLPSIRRSAESDQHEFGVDGNIRVADVFIDPLKNGATFPDADDRRWRTVALGGLREGGAAYYALDLTQPDLVDSDNIPLPNGAYVPSCFGAYNSDGGNGGHAAACGAVPFGSALWEWNDTVYDSITETFVQLDEDGNGVRDLGDAWSTPNIGRIRLCTGTDCDPTTLNNDIEDRYVAVFGGGMDPSANKLSLPDALPATLKGNWIYMLDIETGELLYKRSVRGSVAADVAAVDSDQDGFLDRIYAGTVSGLLYRVDLVYESNGDVPSLASTTVNSVDGVAYSVDRIPATDGSGDPLWEPIELFDANTTSGASPSLPRAIFHAPSVLFVANLGEYAIAFGTGDREDLWAGDVTGRFVIFVDDSRTSGATLPMSVDNLTEIVSTSGDTSGDLLSDSPAGQRGWYIELEPSERAITETFALSGVLFVATYTPDILVTGGGGGGNGNGGGGGGGGADATCSKTGESRIYVVNATNANAFLRDDFGTSSRSAVVNEFVTSPYAESGQTANDQPTGDEDHADALTPDLEAVMESLKSLFPRNCKFANYRVDVKTVKGDTGIVFIAPVPVCIIEKNWKEY